MRAALAAMLAALVFPTGGLACEPLMPFDFRIFRAAELVVRARLTGFVNDEAGHFANVTLEDVEALPSQQASDELPKGRVWTVRWPHNDYIAPSRWMGPERVILGLRAVLEGNGETVIEIVQGNCRPIAILDDTPDIARRVTDAWDMGYPDRL